MPGFVHTNFGGGISPHRKDGLPGAFHFAQNMDIYEDHNTLTLKPKTTKDSGATVIGLIKWFVEGSPYSTDKYGYDDAGNIYKRTSAPVWSVDRATATIGNGAAGQGLCVFNDYLYYATSTTLGRKGLLSGTPGWNDDFLSDGTTNLDQSSTGTANNYTPLTGVPSEAAADKHFFTVQYDPIKSIQIYVNAKGSGDWTLTVHDANNTLIGAKTIANASLNNTANNTFTFATALRVVIGNTYHFHVTSTVADGTMGVTGAADMSDGFFNEYFGILIADANFHPIIQHTNGVAGTLIVGNEDYFAEYNQAGYNPNKVKLLPGYSVRFFVKENEFIIGFCWRGTTIDGSEDGMAFYWDGISPYYNYAKPVKGGLPNAGVNFKNKVFTVLGSNAALCSGTEPFSLVQELPLGRGKKVEVLPGAMCIWQNRMLIGVGTNADDSTELVQGVYEYGNETDRPMTTDDVYDEVLNFSFTISTGTTQSTSMKIGCVAAFGKDLFISWKDGASYGMDKVTKGDNPAATGSWESLDNDYSATKQGGFIRAPQKQKLAKVLVVNFEALPVGCTVTPKYRLDNAASFTTGTAAVAGDTRVAMDISKRYRDINYGFDVTATVNYPVITGVYFMFDPLIDERETS